MGKKKADIKRHGWTKPVDDFAKLNVDAGFDVDSGRGGSGAIIRDDHGRFVTARSAPLARRVSLRGIAAASRTTFSYACIFPLLSWLRMPSVLP